MKIILICNYLPDKQESMNRFAYMLEQGLIQKGVNVTNWTPVIIFGKIVKVKSSGFGKWIGYIDKWILFPIILKYRILKNAPENTNTFYHVCDHSNAPYLKYLPKEKTGITCHDVLAIRGALGYTDAYCSASFFGKILQKWILKNLIKARRLACVSMLTYQQLHQLAATDSMNKKKWMVIHNAFNADFAPMPADTSIPFLAGVGINISLPYILHVGSALQRKNRALLIDMLFEFKDKWAGIVCFAGQAIDKVLQDYIENKGMKSRVISIVKPDHSTLTALYTKCEAFVFPSFSEGFGWPVIEAQACGAPVICSNIEPMPEVSGGAALYANPYDAKSFADALLSLKKEENRINIISKGFENVQKFSLPVVIEEYLNLYDLN